MNTADVQQLQRTALYDRHVAAGARIVPFAGWDMPVQYAGVRAEHTAVRTGAGMFDVSHMGQLVVSGDGAEAALNRVLSNDLGRIPEVGMAQYTLLTNERGGIEDDLIVYRQADGSFLLVVNAANTDHDEAWINAQLRDEPNVVLENQSAMWAMLAVQGPYALAVVRDVTGIDLTDYPNFRCVEATYAGSPVLVSTTGYTGERGCEIVISPSAVTTLWDALAADDRMTLCGLAARDTLRLEACYPLHGNDISSTTSAVGAGLAWACGFTTEFVGSDVLQREREAGVDTRLVAVRMEGRGIPRAGCQLLTESGDVVGSVTSGTMSPTLGYGIAMGWCAADSAAVDTPLIVDVRGTSYAARVVSRPLYRSPSN